jgi:hypothetical protein
MQYPDGRYCGHHARMMTPLVQRAALGVPEAPKAAAKTEAAAGGPVLEAEPG